METRLLPIEKPGLLFRLAYKYSKMKFGKVLTPLKVAYARLPLAFSLFSNKIASLDSKLKLHMELLYLIRHHVAQINICTFCMDIGVAIAMKEGMNEEKFHEVDQFMTSSLFSQKERMALKFADELTTNKKISEETFVQARQYFTERELVEIVWIVATEHYYNLVNLAFDIHSDQLCDLKKRQKV